MHWQKKYFKQYYVPHYAIFNYNMIQTHLIFMFTRLRLIRKREEEQS